MHSEQVADTSSLNMFFDDEAFAAVVLGGNFFRVAGISTTFAAPPICRDDHVPVPDGGASTQPTPKELTMLIAAPEGDAQAAVPAALPPTLRFMAYFITLAATLAALAVVVKGHIGNACKVVAKHDKSPGERVHLAEEGPLYVQFGA